MNNITSLCYGGAVRNFLWLLEQSSSVPITFNITIPNTSLGLLRHRPTPEGFWQTLLCLKKKKEKKTIRCHCDGFHLVFLTKQAVLISRSLHNQCHDNRQDVDLFSAWCMSTVSETANKNCNQHFYLLWKYLYWHPRSPNPKNQNSIGYFLTYLISFAMVSNKGPFCPQYCKSNTTAPRCGWETTGGGRLNRGKPIIWNGIGFSEIFRGGRSESPTMTEHNSITLLGGEMEAESVFTLVKKKQKKC